MYQDEEIKNDENVKDENIKNNNENNNNDDKKNDDEERKNRNYKGIHLKKQYIILIVLFFTSFIIIKILSGGNKNTNKKEKETQKIEETSKIDNTDLNFAKDYSQIKDEDKFANSNQDSNLNTVATTNSNITTTNNVTLSKEEQEELKELREAAKNAKKSVIAFQTRNSNSRPIIAPTTGGKDYSHNDINMQGEKRRFLDKEPAYDNYIKAEIENSISPFEIKAGDFIPAIMITAMNSDLPSKVITAQIRQNVYDTVTGQYLLIPQGTRVIGTYDSNVSWGQNRLLVIWQRMIFPNGTSINLENMQGVDLTGQAGVTGKVNNHFFTLLKGVILSSAMGAAAAIVTDDDDDNNWKEAAGEGAGQTIVDVGNKWADKAINRQPTIEIKQGERFNIMVHSDLILRPYI